MYAFLKLTICWFVIIVCSFMYTGFVPKAARKRSRLHGKRVDDDSDKGEGKDDVHDNRSLGGTEDYVTSWKPYKCPVPGCLKRYVVKR